MDFTGIVTDLIILGLFIIGVFTFETIKEMLMKHKHKENEQKGNAVAMSQTPSKPLPRTKDLFLETLTNIGCQYQIEEDNKNRTLFDFQGEHFFADTSDDSLYVHLYDPYWEYVELYDIDGVSRMRKAINSANLETAVTTIYVIDNVGKKLDVHSKATILFIPTIQNLELYLKTELCEFFRAHEALRTELHKLKEQEQTM